MARQWYVFCGPDRFCVIYSQASMPGHRLLKGPFGSEEEAIAWRVTNCKKYQPNPAHPPDWKCP